MKKLYTIKKVVETCFVAEDNLHPDEILRRGIRFLKEEESWNNNTQDPVEITDIEQLDESWHECLPWGTNEEVTVKNFFRLQKLKAFE